MFCIKMVCKGRKLNMYINNYQLSTQKKRANDAEEDVFVHPKDCSIHPKKP